jgi:hypothetical protein
MEVSAKTGSNIKEFFKELAYVISGGGKKAAKEEPVAANKPTQGQPAVNNSVSLTAQGHNQAA